MPKKAVTNENTAEQQEQNAVVEESEATAEAVEDTVEAHQRTIQAEIADMGIDHENHRKSPHRINICYPLLCHINCKSTEKRRNSWLFQRKLLFLQKNK